jgi:hypothetical protein
MRIAIAPVLALMSLTPLLAQETTATTIPHLVRFTATFHPANGLPVGPTESATLSVYAEEQGGTPLWQETQNVALDAEGHYTAMLGATQNDGVPLDLFTASSPRWLGVMFNRPGETEQPRVQLVSVPYAMRAADAETLGGRPASSYLLDPNAAPAGNASAGGATASPSASGKSLKPRTISGNMNYIPYFTDNSNDLGNSVLYQSGSYVGLGTTGPARKLDVVDGTSVFQMRFSTGLNGGGIGADGNGFFRVAGAIGGAFGTGNISQGTFAEVMRIWNGNVGIGTTGPARKLDVVDGTAAFQMRFSTGTGLNEAGIGADANGFFRMVGAIGGAFGTGSVSQGTFAEVMRIWNGNVGIGTTSPVAKLDVAGNINFSGLISYQGTPVQQFSSSNTASGFNALAKLSTGANNTAVGGLALNGDTDGSSNTGIGYFALDSNADGSQNTAVGALALESTVGTSNGSAGSGNTAVGWGALQDNQTGNDNIAIGNAAGSSITGGSNNIDIGNTGVGGDSSVIRIGNSANQTSFYAAGVSNVNLASGENTLIVVIDSVTGQLGVASASSRRYKEDIQDMGDASSGLMRLRPVTFRYKKPNANGSQPIQYGLIAEEVAQVYPDMVTHNADGQIEAVKYQLLGPLLLNEVQKQQQQIGQQQEEIQKLEEQNRAMQERLEKLEAAIEAGSH